MFRPLHTLLMSAYYAGTLPYRRWRNARLLASGRTPIPVFFYHRIAADRCVPWSHTHEEFERQMLWLKEHFELITLEEVQRRIRSGHNPGPAACITFDDGYAENCDRAIPFLVEQRIPCTYYVNTWFIREQQPFPHDLALGKRLLPNTVQQLRYMSEAGIDVAAHTRTHADMGKIHRLDEIRAEISGCGDELEQILGRRVRHFAFPYGLPCNMTSAAFRVAREHGYESVSSAYGDYNYPGDDGFHIRRIHPDNMTVLRNWATFDPRKLGYPVPYDYQTDSHIPSPVPESKPVMMPELLTH